MKEISLTKGKVALIDDSDYGTLSQVRWHASGPSSTGKFYAVTTQWEGGGHQYMHRIIMCPSAEMEVDHKDGNPLNNQRHNLRVATHGNNLCNMDTRRGSSPYKGIHWREDAKKWRAYISHAGKRTYLGYFAEEVEAALAYDEAARQLHGEYARLNFGN